MAGQQPDILGCMDDIATIAGRIWRWMINKGLPGLLEAYLNGLD